MITAGLDIGSRNTKLVIWDTLQERIIDKYAIRSGTEPYETAKALLTQAAKKLCPERDQAGNQASGFPFPVYTTGYGRKLLNYDYVSEISCHAKGTGKLLPHTMTVIDIGGQDSKAISMNKQGNVIEFAMNDKCAAGTGSFLEKVAELFGMPIESLSQAAEKATGNVEISSTCVVFAESEIISLVNRKVSREDILLAVHRSVAKRIKNMLSNIEWKPPVSLTGGVALNRAVVRTLEEELQTKIEVTAEPLFTGALGAAIFAADKGQKL